MKKNLLVTLGLAIVVVAGAAASQETSAPQRKAKPSAGRIASHDATPTPAQTLPAATSSMTSTTTTATQPAPSSQSAPVSYSAPAATAPMQDSPQRETAAPAAIQLAQTTMPAAA